MRAVLLEFFRRLREAPARGTPGNKKERWMGGWIGVDLDGTLAHYDGRMDPIGEPVPAMAARVRLWLIQDREVRIVTARASVPTMIPAIEAWCEKHFGQRLPVTCCKDFGMVEMWDDRCVQVEVNTGRRIDGKD